MALENYIPGTPPSLNNDPNGAAIGNSTDAISEIFEDDFKALLAMLEQRNMKPGKFLGAGRVGVAYELETMDGKKIDSAVLRFDPEGASGNLDSAVAIDQVAHISSENFTATIVPRASEWELNKEELKQTLSVLNAERLFDRLTDLQASQFMHIEGIDLPVLADPTSMCKEGGRNWGGDVSDLCELQDVQINKEEVLSNKASPELINKIQAQKNAVGHKVRAELAEKGINIETVPSKSNVKDLDNAIDEPGKDIQKG